MQQTFFLSSSSSLHNHHPSFSNIFSLPIQSNPIQSNPMASSHCSLGTQNVKVLSQERVGLSQHFGTRRSWISRKSLQYARLVASKIQSVSRSEDGSEEIKSSGSTSELFPNFNDVKFLLTNLCDTASIGELELKLDGFHLRVVRDLTEKSETLPPSIPAHVSINTPAEAPKPNGSVSTLTTLAISKPVPSSLSIQGFLEKAADEGLVIIHSPMVGLFRRSRTIKGNRAPPSCEEMQKVEEGKVICYIEQLARELPIESDVSGEVIKILRKDGDPVGYGDALIAILPSFPGIKKLQY